MEQSPENPWLFSRLDYGGSPGPPEAARIGNPPFSGA